MDHSAVLAIRIKRRILQGSKAKSMANAPVDLLALNRQILLNPSAAGGNELVALLELEQPGLEFLCPLARAIYWVETNRQGRIDANEILGSLWVVDESEARGTGEYGEYADVTEMVHHSMPVRCGATEVKLGFESSSKMVYHGEFWPKWVRCACVTDLSSDSSFDHYCLIEEWFAKFDEKTSDAREQRSPQGYPTDSGEFIGTCRYTLTSINGIAVEGPTFSDTYHEQEWEGLHENYPQHWDDDGDEEDSSFCWLHYLSREQAEQIGIASKGEEALGPDEDYPEWVSKKLITQGEGLWIDSDQIQSSYSEGIVIVEPSMQAWLAVGCGPEWDPNNHPDDQVNPEDGEWEQYPGDAGPLLRIEISRDEEVLPPELAALLPYIEKLHSLST